MKYTRAAAAVAALAAAATLSACDTGDGAATATRTPTTTAEPTTGPSDPATAAPTTTTTVPAADLPTLDDVAEAAYLGTVSGLRSPGDDAALNVGYATCALLSTGTTPEELAAEAAFSTETVVPGFNNEDLPMFYGAAIGSLCQEYDYMLGLDLN